LDNIIGQLPTQKRSKEGYGKKDAELLLTIKSNSSLKQGKNKIVI
jgi:hypothetical protein